MYVSYWEALGEETRGRGQRANRSKERIEANRFVELQVDVSSGGVFAGGGVLAANELALYILLLGEKRKQLSSRAFDNNRPWRPRYRRFSSSGGSLW